MNSSNLKYYNIDVLISKVNIPFRNNIIPKQKKVRKKVISGCNGNCSACALKCDK